MSRKVISVENIWKQYRLGTVGSGMLGKDISRWWSKVRGNEDPFSVIGENDRTKKSESEFVWALQDISFSLEQGEVLGIIGRNGAGKSTLLKILSRITSPTRGQIKIKGRIASLLEVGTGFHGELTGRENIFINGAILGMKKREIQSKLDEIVAFSGVEKYIDTPVKRYSSGMYVRLAFAVAAHLEPEILILDEVLAVGDVEFQKKCLGKMKDVSEQGRTVLFVSHNMSAVKNLCTKGIHLENGKMVFSGEINEMVNNYLRSGDVLVEGKGEIEWNIGTGPGGEEVRLKSIRLLNVEGLTAHTFFTSKPIQIEIKYEVTTEIVGSRVVMQLIDNNNVVILSSTNHSVDSGRKPPGIYSSCCYIPANLLNQGRHNVFVQIGIPGVKVLVHGKQFLNFDTVLMGNNGSTFPENWAGVVAPKLEWETQKL
ncbi:MAG: ABC transporter ATP-binding protein [Bacteroidota bacterium]|nr:ABC transporter ATP-binding protein [Bacteroidota bacterium]